MCNNISQLKTKQNNNADCCYVHKVFLLPTKTIICYKIEMIVETVYQFHRTKHFDNLGTILSNIDKKINTSLDYILNHGSYFLLNFKYHECVQHSMLFISLQALISPRIKKLLLACIFLVGVGRFK